MRNNAVKGLLLDAAAAIRSGRFVLAHRLICYAERLAYADKTISLARCTAIRTARNAIASTF